MNVPSPYDALVVRNAPSVQQLGQAPATELTAKRGFSNIEKIMLVSVLISGVSLATHLWELNARKKQVEGLR